MSGQLKTINLALQGGGSHGAYTWGVLDALLEDGRLHVEAVSGASAGAMNAVVMADGWLDAVDEKRDPRDGARTALRDFWDAIGQQPSAFALSAAFGTAHSHSLAGNPIFLWLDLMSRLFSPYQLNPLNVNPLRTILHNSVDFERLRARFPFKLFVCATTVRTSRARIFREHEIDLERVLASACLPMTFQAVSVDGEFYWDGGYVGNPALWPLFYATSARDLVLVPINPLRRDDVPDTAQEIIDRVTEISFNSSLFQELRAIDFVQRLLRDRQLDPARYRTVYMHQIAAEDTLRGYDASSKYNTDPEFLHELFTLGRATAQEWLAANFEYIGHASSVDIAATFL